MNINNQISEEEYDLRKEIIDLNDNTRAYCQQPSVIGNI